MTNNNTSDGRTKRVTFYVNAEERDALKQEADDRGKSLSGYCLQLIRRQRQLDAEEQLAEDLNVEQRLTQIVNEAAEDMADAAQALEEQQRLSGKYSIALWELLKADYADPKRRDAIATSHERLNKVIDMEAPPDADDLEEDEPQSDSGKAKSVDELLDR
ncbi:hypothetical protein HAPAU_42110 [Halalkalicoccus paucihalophilus]|uniref:Uncharacterized protein n=1 Tax=Halalkalicoccus paucihalophilus TaxID=1008153 RepID=A0A151A7S7_9EURY|nr:hypothetical protein [Halalkalicoccus paucihalophilus]KYH23731.1 hypothetical protein HAPAU_42110 [Halalkalicoccus paucihalophilus]